MTGFWERWAKAEQARAERDNERLGGPDWAGRMNEQTPGPKWAWALSGNPVIGRIGDAVILLNALRHRRRSR